MAKPPSWNEIRANARVFSSQWDGVVKENAEAQTFWNEFLAIFGVERRRVAYFEAQAQRASTGGRGRIDLFWPSVMLAEHKSAGGDLEAAERQALDYLDALEVEDFPGVIVTSDFGHLRVRDLGGNNQPYEFALRDLPKEIDRFGFIAGYRTRGLGGQQEAKANQNAAKLMGDLYELLAASGYEGHHASVLMMRLLFLMFGDDTGMWERGLFEEFVETRTQPDGTDLGAQLAYLFQVLDTPVARRPETLDELLRRFPYVNGGLFHERIDIPTFDRVARQAVLVCSHFDWSAISPAIFGSMFQAVKTREARRDLGEHYTTEGNISKVIDPLFLDDLHAEFERVKDSERGLKALRARLGRLRLLDPACGCGNFLVVAYRELRRLELAILLRLRDLTGQEQLILDPTLGLQVGMHQFHGIEVEEWPARIAETAMFLTDHQANLELAQEFGVAPDRLPIEVAAKIVLGNATRMDWSEVAGRATADTIVLGNPPFIGMAWLTAEQQEDNRAAFALVDASGLRTGRLDYVACWYVKALHYLANTPGRAAFVSTNSITQGEQARTMHPLLLRHGFRIDFAHRSFRWTSEAPGAAVVHVVVVGFSFAGQAAKKRLFDYPTLTGAAVEAAASNINFYLVDGTDQVPGKRYTPLLPGLPMASKGSQPTDDGGLIVEAEDVGWVRLDPLAAKYLRPFRQSTEMLYSRERWCLWLVDAAPSDLHASPMLQERLHKVAEARRRSPTASVQAQAATPALFTQIRQPTTAYLALPEVSSENRDYVPGRYYGPDVIAGNKLIVVPDAPLWLFAYLHSACFNAWVRAFAGRMKSDPSLSASTVYFTFPFAEVTGAARDRLDEAGRRVLDARDQYPGETLAALYDPIAMPMPLRAAHAEVDRQVDRLHGMRRGTEGQRLKALLTRYEQLTDPLRVTAPANRAALPTGDE